jgi:hypothetical protein
MRRLIWTSTPITLGVGHASVACRPRIAGAAGLASRIARSKRCQTRMNRGSQMILEDRYRSCNG